MTTIDVLRQALEAIEDMIAWADDRASLRTAIRAEIERLERQGSDRDAVIEECAALCEEFGEYWHAEKDAALLNDQVNLSNAMSGEARAGRFLAAAIRRMKEKE